MDSYTDTVSIQVPGGKIGRVIGARGAKIREIQERSETKIQVSRDDEKDGMKLVDITGSQDQIEAAKALIEQCVNGDDRGNFSNRSSGYDGGRGRRDDQSGGGRDWRSGRSNGQDDDRGYRGSNSQQWRDRDDWRGGGRSGGQGEDRDNWGGRGRDSYGGRDERGGRSGFSRDSRDDSGGNKEEIFVLSFEVGRLIGSGGSKIKSLQSDSNCRIKVSRDGANGVNSVELIGSTAEIEDAKLRIAENVDIVDCNGTKTGGNY